MKKLTWDQLSKMLTEIGVSIRYWQGQRAVLEPFYDRRSLKRLEQIDERVRGLRLREASIRAEMRTR